MQQIYGRLIYTQWQNTLHILAFLKVHACFTRLQHAQGFILNMKLLEDSCCEKYSIQRLSSSCLTLDRALASAVIVADHLLDMTQFRLQIFAPVLLPPIIR